MAKIDPKTVRIKDSKSMDVSTVTQGDAESILSFTKEVYQESPFLISTASEITDSVDEESNWILSHLNNPANLMIKAEIESKIVALLRFESDPRSRRAHVGDFRMFVKKDSRGLGIGTELLKVLIDWSKSHTKIEKICLSVFANNERALLLYKKLGFEEESTLKNDIKFENGEYTDSILMFKFVKASGFTGP